MRRPLRLLFLLDVPCGSRHLDGMRLFLAAFTALTIATASAATVHGWPDIAPRVASGERHPEDAALLIGIESYDRLPTVPYASRDVEAWSAWARLTRGIPGHRIETMRDPDAWQIEESLERATRRVGPDGTLWVAFIGHGAIESSDGSHLLLASNAGRDGGFSLRSPLSVESIQAALASDDAGHAILVVDAGFSGAGRSGEAVSPHVTVPAPPPLPVDPTVVTWLATSPGEWAGPLDEARHGLFTWHVIASLRGWADGVFDEPDGILHLEEVQTWVERRMRETGRSQNPSRDPRAATRAWVLAHAAERPPRLEQDTPAKPMNVPRFIQPATLGDTRERQADPTDPRDVEARLRSRYLARVDDAWARAYGRAMQGDLDGLRIFIQQYGSITFWHKEQGRMYEMSAPQVPKARRMLANGGRDTEPLVATVTLDADTVSLGSPVGTPGREPSENLTRARLTRSVAIGRTEITQAVYATVTGTNPNGDPDPSHPVTGVSWYQAVAFCNGLSTLDGFDPAYTIEGRRVQVDLDANGWRLPTEAEWTLAAASPVPVASTPCAAGNLRDASAVRREDPELARTMCDDGFARLAPVTAHRPTRTGVYGLHGNAVEWTDDGWSILPGVTVTDPNPRGTPDRVVKGPSYTTPVDSARVTARLAQPADTPRDDLGFRVVRTLPPGASTRE